MDVMYKMIDIINTDACYRWEMLRVNFKSSYHKENLFFYSLILYLYEMMDVH